MKRFLSRYLPLAFGKRIALTNDPVVGEATTTFALSSKLQASRMFLKGIMCCALISSLVGCKSIEVVSSSVVQDVQKFRSVDTILLRDTVFRHDSIIYRERTVLDTVYITKEVYRDRLEARGERQKAVRTDTVVVTEYRDRIVEKPPEKYVPKFYKWCTIALWLLIALGIGYWALKRWL